MELEPAAAGARDAPDEARPVLRDAADHADRDVVVRVNDPRAGLERCTAELVVEAAGHSAVRDFGEAILGQGMDLYALSAGALRVGADHAQGGRAVRAGGVQSRVGRVEALGGHPAECAG